VDEQSSEKSVSHNGKRRIYRLLCCLAWCDGEMHTKEREYLDAFVAHFSIRPDEAGPLESEGKISQELGISKRPSERRLLVDALIDIAMADGQLVAAEQKKLIKFGKTIGLTEDDLASRIIDRVQASGRNLSPSRRYEAFVDDES
jgi:uncharacterized tellurite resistance protein B-like protein